MQYRTLIVDAPFVARWLFEAKGPDATIPAALQWLIRLEAEHKPCHMVLCWERNAWPDDGIQRGTSFVGLHRPRAEIVEGYKANRPEPDPRYATCVKSILEGVQRLGWFQYRPMFDDGEADDVAATVSSLTRGPHLLWTADKDWAQLVRANVHMARWRIRDHAGDLLTPETIAGVMGWPAELIPSYLALCGDASDNVPGAPQIGPHRATDLLKACPDLLQRLDANECEFILRAGEAAGPGIGKWFQKVIDSRDLVLACWDVVTLRSVDLCQLEPDEGPTAEAAILWAHKIGLAYLEPQIRQYFDRP
jgi:hypothetical protein